MEIGNNSIVYLQVRCHRMSHVVKSRFSISSPRFDAGFLTEMFPWRVVETDAADQTHPHITVFDLGVGEHHRVDSHLVAAKAALLKHESDLDSICGDDCGFVLWISYRFPTKDGAININPSASAAFGLLRVELVFHLTPHDT